MRRKLFKPTGLRRMATAGALLLTAGVARAQEAVQAQMWAATARYVYNDDPNLKPLAAKLSTELGEPKTLGEFEQRLAAAANEAAAASKTPNIKVLQRQFQNMRALNAVELNDNLPDSLSKTAVRRQGERKQKLDALENTLMTLAQSTGGSSAGPTPASAGDTAPSQAVDAPVAAASSPAIVEATAPTSPLTWAALVMSGLSLLGVIRILSSRRSRRSSSTSSSEAGRSHHSSSGELSPEQHREVEAMIAKALASQSDKQVVAPKLAPKLSPTPTAPPQSVKQKLASNSPKTMRPQAAEASPVVLPPLASMTPEATAPAPPVAEAPTPAAEPEPIPAVVEPGTSIDLDVTPVATPQVRQQFVNEAPFNNTFAARTLSDTLAPYSIYEVQARDQTPDQGQFRVVGNLVSHISNHRNILEPVCEYVAYPQGGETRIITEQPGEVRRRGEDWEVVRRARIRFE